VGDARPFARLLCVVEALERRALLSGAWYVDDASREEGDAGTPVLRFRITLVGALDGEPGAITATTSDGTASAAEGDYVHQQRALVFAPQTGTRVGYFDVAINPDTRDESNETVIVTLSMPGPAAIADGTAVGTIIEDDDHRPNVRFDAVTPSPRETPVNLVTLRFTEPVVGFDLSDLSLWRGDNRQNLLTANQGLSTADNIVWNLNGLSALTSAPGVYTLYMSGDPVVNGIHDAAFNPLFEVSFYGAQWVTGIDPDDQISEAGIVGNGSIDGWLNYYENDNVDLYGFVALAGDIGTFEVRATSGPFDPVLLPHLRLFNAAGNELTSDGARIDYTFAAGGTYYVGVSEEDNAYDPVTGADTNLPAGGRYALSVTIKSRMVPTGPEFRANTHTPNIQAYPATAMDADGDFVVVWASKAQDSLATDGVYGQRYNAAGVAQGSEFLVNNTTAGNQYNPQVAMDAAGNFVIAWQGVDASEHGIFARRYNAAGVAQGGEFLVNTVTANFQTNPTVAMDADGDFVVAWQSQNQVAPLSANDVYAQRYARTGAVAGTEFLVNTVTTSQQRFPTAAMDADGDFVIAWESENRDPGNSTGIYAQRYDAAGGTLGGEFRVNNYTVSDQNLPSAAMDADGDFVVTWHGYEPRDGNGVYARRFNAAGVAQGGDIQVNTSEHSFQRHTAIAMDADGDFVISWQNEHGDANLGGTSVDAQRFTAAGARVGGEFRVNTTTLGNHTHPAAAMDPDGDFVIAWASYGQDPGDNASTSGIYVQRYASEQLAVTAATFLYQTLLYETAPHMVRFTFNQDVRLMKTSLVRLGPGGGPITTEGAFYESSTESAFFFFDVSVLPDGNYRATLSGASTLNAKGEPLGTDYVLDFFVLSGDANRDRGVGFADLVILAQNYGTTGKNFSQGNFSYDAAGAVGFADLVILAQKYNATLPPPISASTPLEGGLGILTSARPAASKDQVFKTGGPIRRPLAASVKRPARQGGSASRAVNHSWN
jgi:hypothetical protein